MQKRVVAIHDISCYGKCSLTIVLPVLSSLGIATSVLPTSILSTHTGGLGKPYMHDLSDDLKMIVNHWKSLKLSFDALYTGYVSTLEQLHIISNIFDEYTHSLHYVDPVMGDHGKLYSALNEDIVSGMRSLCAKADIITPNLTEACLLVGQDYQEGPYTKVYIEDLLGKLRNLGAKNIILTGVYFDENKIGVALYEEHEDFIQYAMYDKVAGAFHGTGDLFASCFLGAILKGLDFSQAAKLAIMNTANCIKQSVEEGIDERAGVNFEDNLINYAQQVNNKCFIK